MGKRRGWGRKIGRSILEESKSLASKGVNQARKAVKEEIRKLPPDKRTQLDGAVQLAKWAVKDNPVVQTVSSTKEITEGFYKVADPKGYRKTRREFRKVKQKLI